MADIMEEQKKIANEIHKMRLNGEFNRAIEVCKNATEKFSEDNFFYKILGDLYFVKGRYSEALDCYVDFLKRIRSMQYLLNNFFRFVEKIRKSDTDNLSNDLLKDKLLGIIVDDEIPMEYQSKLITYIYNNFDFDDSPYEKYVDCLYNHNKGKELQSFLSGKETDNKELYVFYFVLTMEVKRRNSELNINNYKIVVSSMEKNKFYVLGIYITTEMLKSTTDGVVIRTLLRLCRYSGDYSAADIYLTNNPNIPLKGDFNIQYELVYYYKNKNDFINLKKSLEKIRLSAKSSIPISKTLYNFYLQFEMLEEASIIIDNMEMLKQQEKAKRQEKALKKGEDTAEETDEGVWNKLRNIVSEQEHNRQLIATKDLIKGFSHELGQPLTNIRYDISYYYMRKELNLTNESDIDDTLKNVLRQIERIDKLIKRFSPIFSSKSEEMSFSVVEEILNVFEELKFRLKTNNINYKVLGNRSIKLFGDPLKFHQILYNLIINSIHSINEKGINGEITSLVEMRGNKIFIRFTDNGMGIPNELISKIFEPFFSTKKTKTDISKDEGGEGLGLYIVWNIIKIFNGTIKVDTKKRIGAQFNMEFILEERR